MAIERQPTQTTDIPQKLRFAFNTERKRGTDFSYPEASLETVEQIINERGLNDRAAVFGIIDVLERHSLDGTHFNRLTDRHGGVGDARFNERDIVFQYTHDTHTLIDEIEKNGYEAMIYLDKSARPPEALVDAFWEQRAKPGTERPTSDFLNIDRGQILRRHGFPVTEYTSNEQILEWTQQLLFNENKYGKDLREDAARIRTLFVDGLVGEDDISKVFDMPSRLDGKSICIVDEVKSSGATKRIAEHLLKLAFPESKISSTYFWHGPNASVPIWYEKDYATGRGVGDPDPVYYRMIHEKEQSADSLKRVIGSFALSAPHYYLDDSGEVVHYDDKAYELLLEDIQTLAGCELFSSALSEDFDRDIEWNTALFYKKLADIGYTGPRFDQEIVKSAFYGDADHRGQGYLVMRKQLG